MDGSGKSSFCEQSNGSVAEVVQIAAPNVSVGVELRLIVAVAIAGNGGLSAADGDSLFPSSDSLLL
jgi:hypothetical protein